GGACGNAARTVSVAWSGVAGETVLSHPLQTLLVCDRPQGRSGRTSMARLFGIIGNRADLMARVFALEGALLKTKAKGVPLGWGLGFYQGGEVLIRRRPIDERQEVDVASLVSDVRADVVIG